jgi:hypothetical protein
MITILCDKCNNFMTLSEQKTLESYTRELGYEVLIGEGIKAETLQDYTIFTCSACGVIKKYTLADIEFQVRRYLAIEALKIRAITALVDLPEEQRTLDGDLFYCGKCAGVVNEEERDGWCLKHVAKYCRIYKGLKL